MEIPIYNKLARPGQIDDLTILSCTEAGKILNITKSEVKQLVLKGELTNFGNEYRYMVSENEVNTLRDKR